MLQLYKWWSTLATKLESQQFGQLNPTEKSFIFQQNKVTKLNYQA